jgi:membrane-associated HD superfamily phosphohydrolase
VAYNVFLSIGISLSAALLNLGGANGTSGIIYDGWIILVFISGALSLLSLMALMNDRKHVGVALVILLIVASMLSFIAAVLSANLDFVVGANVTTYTGLYWAAVPLGAMGLVDALFALIAAMSMWHKIRVSKGY